MKKVLNMLVMPCWGRVPFSGVVAMEGLEELVAVVAREVAEEGEEAVVAEGEVRERSLDL